MRCRSGAVATPRSANVEPCRKRRFNSEHGVREGHKGASYRVRAYQCDRPGCRSWHATAAEKRTGRYRADEAPLRNRPLAPVRTLAEVEAIARERRLMSGNEHFEEVEVLAATAVLSLGPEGMKFEILRNARG